jgi:RNA polymerase sigma factor (sigma-70 family)
VTTQRLDTEIENLLRELAPQVLGSTVRRFKDFAAAEDAVQEALVAASAQWPQEGLPDNPRAWLIHVATRRMTDFVRSETARRHREERTAQPAIIDPWSRFRDTGTLERDDTLVLLFMCCHPALTPSSAVALTLRAVGGLTTAEIASAFLVPESTMAQRISRAKQTVKASGVPFRMPTKREHPQRLAAVLKTLYLIFNEGYTSTTGAALHRTELSGEAIRLMRAIHRRLPDDPEVGGLLALMLLTDARRPARTGAGGELIPLDRQDRQLWNREAIAEGIALVSRTLPKGSVGPYQLQAAIAAVHDEAPTADETDWPQILALYTVLERMSGNPMVSLNRAIAVAMVHGPAAGMALLDRLDRDGQLAGHYRLDAVRAHLLEQSGDREGAIARYTAAARRTTSIPERDYLINQAVRLSVTGRG